MFRKTMRSVRLGSYTDRLPPSPPQAGPRGVSAVVVVVTLSATTLAPFPRPDVSDNIVSGDR